MSKANAVREIIAAFRNAGNTEINDTLITDVITATGHKRQLARAYIKGNWDKAIEMKVEPIVVVFPADGATSETKKKGKKGKGKGKIEAPVIAEAQTEVSVSEEQPA